MTFDWKLFEQTLLDAYRQDAQALIAAHPDQRFYAFALSQLHREEDGPIFLPRLAANSEQAYAADHGATAPPEGLDSLHHIRWSPPDWRWPTLDSSAQHPAWTQMEPALSAEATRAAPAHWRRTEARLLTALVSVAKQLRRALKQPPWAAHLTAEAIVWVALDDSDEGIALARRCLGDATFVRLFTSHDADASEARRVAALPLPQQVRYHVACLQGVADAETGLGAERARASREAAQHALCAIGGPLAAHALLPLLDDERHQWQAAACLAWMDGVDDTVITALRRHAARPAKKPPQAAGRAWCANALAALGDSPWLLEQCLTSPPGLPDAPAAAGLTYPYRAWNSQDGARSIALDYRPLEAALERCPRLAPLLDKKLAPGGDFCTLRASDVDEALRGLASPHALVRRHAAAIMDNRALGQAVGQRLLPALARALTYDPDAQVRRLAALSLQYWKKASAPWRAEAQAAADNDSDEAVRATARELVQHIDNQFRGFM
ncbi:MAG: DUF4303 domain-containing protein [Pseudomonadota bacterium]|nr:DUF4303 domain-containing protein [Pseudomonadota bacterium]